MTVNLNYSGCKHCHHGALSPASLLEGATERRRVCPSLAFVQYISKSPPQLAVGENLPLCVRVWEYLLLPAVSSLPFRRGLSQQ